MRLIALQKLKHIKNIRYLFLFLFILIIFINSYLFFPISNAKLFDNKEIGNVNPSATRIIQTQWLNNSNFSTEDNWYYTKGDQGDNSTIDANISNGQANYKVLGNNTEYSILSGTVNASTWYGWDVYKNGDFLLPDLAEINTQGCYVYHYLDESESSGAGQVHNFPSVHFSKNVSLPEDLSNFEISSAFLDVIFNASVGSNVDVLGDTVDQSAIWDSATFYVEIADIDLSYSFRVAEYKTSDLGQDSPSILEITDMAIPTVSENDLITAINLALEKHENHSKLTLILGLDIYCEDNMYTGGGDRDLWNALIIKSFNLTFTYASKIEQFTSLAWNQIGNKIEGANFQIKNATLHFKYKSDQDWPSALSPFSEIRIIINNNRYSKTVKLSDAISAFQDAQQGGFDITSLISKGVNISVSIQVFIANTFGLGQNITISIDDVLLYINLIETFPDMDPSIELYLNEVNKTSESFIQVVKDQNINITVRYLDSMGFHISRAQIQLEGEGFIEDLIENESFQQYTAIINSSEKLVLGNNFLTIKTQKINYISKELSPTIFVRKINAEFTTLTGSSTIDLRPGGNAVIRVRLNDTDYDRLIKDAVVFYSWSSGQGTLTDPDNDGIYEGIIRNVPEGTYKITITGSGIEDYNFIDYEITLNAISPPMPDWTWLIIILSGAMVGLLITISLYQFHFKYPPMVRKIRKLRKHIRKEKKTRPILALERKNIIEKNIKDQSSILKYKEKFEENQINKLIKET
jgi:hypothetical protein